MTEIQSKTYKASFLQKEMKKTYLPQDTFKALKGLQ